MNWNLLFGSTAIVTGLTTLWLTAYLSHHFKNEKARSLLGLLLGIALWVGPYGIEILCPGLGTKLIWAKLKYLGCVMVPIHLFSFVLVITDHSSSIHKKILLCLWIWGAVIFIGAITNDWHHLVFKTAWLFEMPGIAAVQYERGALYALYLAVAYTLVAASVLLLVKYVVTFRGIQRKQGLIMLFAILIPWLMNWFFFLGTGKMSRIDMAPIFFFISSLLLVLALFRYHLLRLIPLAREAVMDGLGDPVIVLDMQDRIAKMNHAGLKAFGLPHFPPKLAGFNTLSPRLHHLVCGARGSTPRSFDLTLALTGSGAPTDPPPRHWHVRIAPLRTPYRVQSGWLVVLRDITLRREGEKALRRAKDYVKNIINSISLSIIAADCDGVVNQWNHGAHVLTGIPEHHAMGRKLTQLFSDTPFLYQDFTKAMETGQTQQRGKHRLVINSRELIVDIVTFPLMAGTTAGAVIQISDITEQTRIRAMMVQSEKMMSVGGLAAGLAHEINNPLSGMIQSLQVIKNRLINPLPANIEAAEKHGIPFDRLRQYMEERKLLYLMDLAMDVGLRAAKIVENMLSFSRSQTGEKTCHTLSDIFDSTIALLENDYSLNAGCRFKSIEMKKIVQAALPAIPCEKSMIQQVILNILKNGAQAMEAHSGPGKPDPKFTVRYFMDKQMACVEIQDNGPGIPKDIRSRIFEPFFTTKPVGKGTGLGLSVSYFIIVENHQGCLTVDSVPGGGTAFTIKLPIIPCSEDHALA